MNELYPKYFKGDSLETIIEIWNNLGTVQNRSEDSLRCTGYF